MNVYPQFALNTNNATGTAFGALRTAQPATLFDSKQVLDLGNTFWDDQEVSGTGTSSVYSQDTASTTLLVTNATAGKRLRQTFQRFNYQPGKGQRILMTAANILSTSGIEKGMGIGDDNNGLFFVHKDGEMYMRRVSSVTGTPVVADTPISAFTLSDGTAIDFSTTFILDIDFEWLGVGRVRMAYSHGADVIYFYEEVFANNLAVVYMSTPNLPLRYWVENDGSGITSSLATICSSVQSEGGIEELGITRGASTGGTAITAALENTVYALGGIRVKTGWESAIVKLQSVVAQIQTASESAEYFLALNPTLSGALSYTGQYNSAVEFGVGNGTQTVSGNYISWGYGFAESGAGNSGAASTIGIGSNARYPGFAIDGTQDQIVLCWRPVGGSSGHAVEFGFNWKELV